MMLDKLWALIGDGGCQLDRGEKADFVAYLAYFGGWYWDGASLWDVVKWRDQDSSFPEYPGTTPPIDAYNIEEVLSHITLTMNDCWVAIAQITEAQLVEPSGPLVALIK